MDRRQTERPVHWPGGKAPGSGRPQHRQGPGCWSELAQPGAAASKSSTRVTYKISNGALADDADDADGNGSSAATQSATMGRFKPHPPSDVASAQALFPAISRQDFIVLG